MMMWWKCAKKKGMNMKSQTTKNQNIHRSTTGMYKLVIRKKSSHLHEKIAIREEALTHCHENPRVLDCFHGDGTLWREIEKNRPVQVLGIEKSASLSRFEWIHGDNMRVVDELNISDYDLIDLDAFANPLPLLLKLWPLAKPGAVFVYTFTFVALYGLPPELYGEDDFIRKKARCIQNKLLEQKWSTFFKRLGVDALVEINVKEGGRIKKYGYFVKPLVKST